MSRSTPSCGVAHDDRLRRRVDSSAQRRWIIPALLLLVTAAVALPQTRRAPWDGWHTLRLKVKSVPLFSGRVEVRLGREGGRKVLETSSVAKFLGVRIGFVETQTWFHPETGLAERYISRTKKRARRYVFGESSYSVERLAPGTDRELPFDRWEVKSRDEFPYPTDANGEIIPVYDSYGVLLRLRELPLRRVGDESLIWVATTRGAVAYRIRVAEARTVERRYRDLADGRRHDKPIRELRLRIIPADPEKADQGFLTMEGETEMWVEARSKTLVFLGGKVPRVPGRVRLVLSEIG